MQLVIQQNASAKIERGQAPKLADPEPQIVLASGEFNVDHWRGGKRINSFRFKNGIVNEGKNHLLDVMFKAATQISTWYLGLIDNAGFTALASTDVYAQINGTNGWDEFTTYTDPANSGSSTTRPIWTADAPSNQSITNSSVVVFDITATGTVKGLFLVGGGSAPQTKGDSAGGGKLWATALFSGGDVPVLNGDSLRVTYTVNA